MIEVIHKEFYFIESSKKDPSNYSIQVFITGGFVWHYWNIYFCYSD